MAFKGSNMRVVEETLDKGIDGITAISDIPAGYALEMENVDLSQPGVVRKRPGYNVWGCKPPVRTKSRYRDTNGNIHTLFDSVPFCSTTLRCYLNTSQNATETSDSRILRVDDRNNTVFIEIQNSPCTITFDTIITLGALSSNAWSKIDFQPVAIFNDGSDGGTAKFLLPIQAKVGFSGGPLSDTVALTATAFLSLGYTHPRIVESEISSLEVESVGTPATVKLSFNSTDTANLLPVGTCLYFETCLHTAAGVFPGRTRVVGYVTEQGTDYVKALVAGQPDLPGTNTPFRQISEGLGPVSTSYLSVRYFSGRSFWYISEDADYTMADEVQYTAGVWWRPLYFAEINELIVWSSRISGSVPATLGLTAETGFVYGLDTSAGYIHALNKYFDVDANTDRILFGCEGSVFVEDDHPVASLPTLPSGVYTAASGNIQAVNDTFSIPITGAHLIYQAGDAVRFSYATDVAGSSVTEELTVSDTATDTLIVNAEGRKLLYVRQYSSFIFKRTSSKIYVDVNDGNRASYQRFFNGVALQYGSRDSQKPSYNIKEVDWQGDVSTSNFIVLDSEVEWESDSHLSTLPLFFPVLQTGGVDSILYGSDFASLEDTQSVNIERSVIMAAGVSGMWRFNGSRLINMRIPTPPPFPMRNIKGSGGTLKIDEADDGERIGRYYRFYVSYSYSELVNGKIVRYESPLNPIGSYRIVAKPAIDGSSGSQIVELQVATIPDGIGLPAGDMTINVYRSPSGSANDVEGDTEVLLREREVPNDTTRPFITILAGIAPRLQFNEENYDFLYISQGGDRTQDEATRNIVDVPLASALATLENRVVAANGWDHPYVNLICKGVFAPDGSFAAHARFKLVPPSGNARTTFATCPIDSTTTSGTAGGTGGRTFQVFPISSYEVKQISYTDNSHLFKVTGAALVAGTKYLLRIANGAREGLVPGGKDSYYDGFGFETQTFEATAVATQLSAQKKWTAKTALGVLISPTEQVLVFEESQSVNTIATDSGLFVEGNTGVGELPGGAINFILKVKGSAITYAAGDKLILKGLGTTGLVKTTDGRQLNWDTQIVAEVLASPAPVIGDPDIYYLKLYVMGTASHFTPASLLSAIAVSNTATGVQCPAFTIFKLQTPLTPRAMTDFSLSPTTATIQITTSPAIAVPAGTRICVDGLPDEVPRGSGMVWNTTFEVTNFAVDTFTVKVTPPPTMRGVGGQDFTADPVKGKLNVPSLSVIKSPTYIQIAVVPTVSLITIQAGTWIYMVARGVDQDSYSLELSGWFKVVDISSNGTTWGSFQVTPGGTVAAFRLEHLASSLDLTSITGLSLTRIVAINIPDQDVHIPVPVPTRQSPNSDITGTIYGPFDGYTPLEKVARRLSHAVSTVLQSTHFAYWGKFRADLEPEQDIPTNGVRVQPHLWPDDRYKYRNSFSPIALSSTNESAWECVAEPGYWRVEGSTIFEPTYTPTSVYTIKKYRPSRLWWTNPTGSAEGVAFRELSLEEIESQDGEGIIGIAPLQTYAIAGKRSSVWRLSFGGGTILSVQKIPSTVGVASAKNMVPTERGVFFLHDSGAYITDGGLVEPLLQPTRYFSSRVIQNRDLFPFTAGHHSPLNKTVYLGVPLSATAEETADEVSGQFVFNYSLRNVTLNTIDYGWSVNTQVPATFWTRIKSDDYFAGTNGKIYKIRTERGPTRFSDERQGIPFKISTRFIDSQDPVDFKFYRSLFFQFGKDSSGNMTISLSWDFAQDYTPVSVVEIDKQGFGTAPFGTSYWGCDRYLEMIRRTPVNPRVAQMSIRIENSEVDTASEVYGIFLESSQMTSKLHRQPGT